jgi:hypothetical protein
MKKLLHQIAPILLLLQMATWSPAEVSITEALPIGIRPGEKTRVVIKGQELASPLRVWTSCSAQIEVVSVDPTLATLDVTLPATQHCGPFGICLAPPAGVSQIWTLLADDLPSVAESNSNHASTTAQSIAFMSAVDGTSDGSLADFYRIHLEAAQRVAVDVQSQRIGSTFDPVIRVYGPKGDKLAFKDDDLLGPDSSFVFTATDAGEYIIELGDNRYAAGGRYRLRVGDFPIIGQAYPLAGSARAPALLTFSGANEVIPAAFATKLGDAIADRIDYRSSRVPGGKSSAWAAVAASDLPIYLENSFPQPALPVVSPGLGINGKLTQPREVDRYLIQGEQGQATRFAAASVSLGAPTLVRMQLLNSDGGKVAETAVTDADEFFFDYTFPDSKAYTLSVTDLLNRGGNSLGYFVSAEPLANASIQCFLKPDAKTRDRFIVEPGSGLAAIDLQVARTAYDGPIEFRLFDASPKLNILNPVLPAGNEHRLLIASTEGWTGQSLAAIRIVAVRAGSPATLVRSAALLRLKAPHVNYPHHFVDGQIVVAGVESTPDYFNAQPPMPLVFARVFPDATLKWPLQRTNAEFKDPITLNVQNLPEKFAQEVKLEGDQLSLKLTRAADNMAEPATIEVFAYGDFQLRGKYQKFQVPIRWIDPLIATAVAKGPFVPGQPQKLTIQVERNGDEPQPVTAKFKNLPPGVTGPESVSIAADQKEVEVELQTSGDAELKTFEDLRLTATSTFAGREFTVESKPFTLEIKQP